MAEIAVVGAGPAGVRAAAIIAAAGYKVLLLDEGGAPGGQIYRQPPLGAERPAADLYGAFWKRAVAVHRALQPYGDLIDYRPRTLVWNLQNELLSLWSEEGHSLVHADRVVLAPGAVERIIPFPGWLLPGVVGLGAAQIALKAQGCVFGEPIVFAGTGPLLPLVASQYVKAGADVAVVLDTSPLSAKIAATPLLASDPATLLEGVRSMFSLRRRGRLYRHGVEHFWTLGEDRVEEVVWMKDGRERRVKAGALAFGFGLRSETQLAEVAGCTLVFDRERRQLLPSFDAHGRSTIRGIYLAGDGAGIAGAVAAELTGERAARALLADMGVPADPARDAEITRGLARLAHFRQGIDRAFPFPEHLYQQMPDDLVVCRCEGVTVGNLKAAVNSKQARDLSRVKTFSRLGMGRCQGRYCGSAGAEIMAALLHRNISEVGGLRAQPPIKPVTVPVEELAG